MPIVRYQRQQTIPAIDNSALIKKASTDEVSGAAVAETIGQSVEVLAKRYGEIKKQQDEISLLNKSNQYDTFVTDKIIDIQTNKTGEKAFTALDDFKKENTSYQNELSKDVSDPVQKAKLSNILSNRTNDANLKLATHVAQQKQVALNYGLQNTLDNTTKGVQSGLINVSDGLDIIDTNVHRLATSGIFKSQEEVETKKADLKGKLLETYFDNLNINNPAAVTEMLKNGTMDVRGQAVKFTDWLPVEKLNEIKKTALVMEKSKSLEDERKKIETGLQYVEKMRNTWNEARSKGALTRAHVINGKPKDFETLHPKVQNAYNDYAEKYMGILDAQDKEKKKLIEGKTENYDSTVSAKLMMRASVEPFNDKISQEEKITYFDVSIAADQGLITPKEAKKINGLIEKNYKLSNPLKQRSLTEAMQRIDKAEKDGVITPDTKGDIIYSMNTWLEQNPDKNATEYLGEILKPMATENIIKKLFVSEEEPSEEKIKQRAKDIVQSKKPTAQTKITPAEKVLNGKTYVKQNGKWFEK